MRELTVVAPPHAGWRDLTFATVVHAATAELTIGPSASGLDYFIDGRPLAPQIAATTWKTIFGPWEGTSSPSELLSALVLERPSGLPSGRVQLYACEFCADLWCGSITVDIQRVNDRIVWSRFGYEYPNYVEDADGGIVSEFILEPLEGPAGFVFSEDAYRRALSAAL